MPLKHHTSRKPFTHSHLSRPVVSTPPSFTPAVIVRRHPCVRPSSSLSTPVPLLLCVTFLPRTCPAAHAQVPREILSFARPLSYCLTNQPPLPPVEDVIYLYLSVIPSIHPHYFPLLLPPPSPPLPASPTYPLASKFPLTPFSLLLYFFVLVPSTPPL